MQTRRKVGAFARSHKKHIIAAHALAIAAVAIAFFAGAFAGTAYYKTVYGVKLTPKGVQIYEGLAANQPEKRGHVTPEVTLTPAQTAELEASAAAAAKQLLPNVQATPEPVVLDQQIPRNFYPNRPTSAKYLELVAHDTESPNAPGIQDLEAVRAFFSNPNTQASANYVDDAQGNIVGMVDPPTKTAWHVAYFNQWSIGVEQIGYASQTRWPLLQIEATAKIFAHWATTYGIPIQHGQVDGCKIVKPGIVFHADLGLCGGGHHDPGLHYPLALLIRLTKQYANAGQPVPTHHHHHHVVVVPAVTLRLGATGSAVRLLQKALDAHGAHLAVDGDFGHATFVSVESFQHAHHLAVDGIVGMKTRHALNA